MRRNRHFGTGLPTWALVMLLMVACDKSDKSILPLWPRKYATTVIRGHVTNLPEDEKYVTRIWGGASNIKGEQFPYDIVDSAGVFSMKWDMCWPMNFMFDLCNRRITLLLCPGDTVDVEMDYDKHQDVKDDAERVFSEAVHIRGGFIQRSLAYRLLSMKMQWEASFIPTEYLEEHRDQCFEDYRDYQWSNHLARLDTVMASGLQPEEKEHLRLVMETIYLQKVDLYDFFKHVIGCDSAEVSEFAAQKTLVDPHADSLVFPNSITSAYYFGVDRLAYLKANGLENKPFGKYLQEREKAEKMVEQLKAFRPVSAEAIDSLSPEFRPPLHELAQANQAYANWLPSGEPETWLQQIVNRHPRKVVYMDFWATWCGPCNKGINEMATVKEEYEQRGVDFVYITDNSSSTEGFLEMKEKHSGDHFIFPKSDLEQMNIPGYSGAIPHYLIYDRDGHLVKHITGWGELNDMTQELDKVLAQ